MNIQEAKREIKRTYRTYIRKSGDGSFRIPPDKQRPVLLIGPPGIGKTAIMKQIAKEEGCGLVAYSMTHHTRQSAVGLPFISHKEYGGRSFAVTEYTMSEIVASIYEYMEESGKRSGILFLDEINCVSETLAPVMLQLLQNKKFGNVPIPEGWIIVAAGNPPEYNRSVREMDMATLDRVKIIDVEADLSVWQEYALAEGIHPAVRSYLSIYPDHFYRITEKDGSMYFVTARGWEDLSLMLSSYEEEGFGTGEKWFLQYLQDNEVARSFALYYDLFSSFKDRIPEGPGESKDLADLLLSCPEILSSLSSSECIAMSDMLCHSVRTDALSAEKRFKELEKRKEYIRAMPQSGAFSDEESVRAYFRQERKRAEERASGITADAGTLLLETGVLSEAEKELNEWLKLPKGERASAAAFLKEKTEAAEREAGALIRALEEKTENSIRALKACPEGRSALLYFLHDVSQTPVAGALASLKEQE